MYTLPSSDLSLIGHHCLFLKQPALNWKAGVSCMQRTGLPLAPGAVRGLQSPPHYCRTKHLLCNRLFTCLLCVTKLFTVSQLILTATLGNAIAPFHRQGNWVCLIQTYHLASKAHFFHFLIFFLPIPPPSEETKYYSISGLCYNWWQADIVIFKSHPIFHKGNSNYVCLTSKPVQFSCHHITLPLPPCPTR